MISIICSWGHGEVVGFFFSFCLIQCSSVSQEDAYKNEDLHFELVALLFAFHFVKKQTFFAKHGENLYKKTGSAFRLLTKASPAIRQRGTKDQTFSIHSRLFLTLYVPSGFGNQLNCKSTFYKVVICLMTTVRGGLMAALGAPLLAALQRQKGLCPALMDLQERGLMRGTGTSWQKVPTELQEWPQYSNDSSNAA